MPPRKPFCPDCGQILSEPTSKCPHCGRGGSHKTVAEAYGTWGGMGLFDLIPGIRDLPDPVRRTLMIVFVGVVVTSIILVPRLYMLYQRFGR